MPCVSISPFVPPHSFLSCAYDKHVKVWDTEAGKALLDVTNGKVPYCGTWYPLDQNVFLVGSANKKIVQYDLRTVGGWSGGGANAQARRFALFPLVHDPACSASPAIAQSVGTSYSSPLPSQGAVELEYNYHLGAVNTVTFVDEARRIVSTSDDKKVLVWDFNTPVPNKYIQGEDRPPPTVAATTRRRSSLLDPPHFSFDHPQIPPCTPSPPWRCTPTAVPSLHSPWTTSC